MGKMEAFHWKCLQWQMYIGAFRPTSLLVIFSAARAQGCMFTLVDGEKTVFNQLCIITLYPTGYCLSQKFSVISEIF